MGDLEKIKSKEVEEIVGVVFFRKERNSLFDFIFHMWDTGALAELGKRRERGGE